MADAAHRALLIGNSTFPSDRHNLQDLEGPVNDVALLRDALTDPHVGLFDQHHVRMLPERSMSEILMELERFFSTASRDDRLLLYYSGHGLLTEGNQLLLCARDTRTDLAKSTTVSAGAINSMIDESAAQTTVIILDCCYSGAFKGASLPSSLKGEGRFLFTSARSGQLANDADRVNGTSLFTQHLVEALVSEAEDLNGDGYVGLSEVYEYVHKCLTTEGRQIPQRNFAGGGDVAVARRPTTTTGQEESRPPVLELSETVIDLRDVEPGSVLPEERVFVMNRGGGSLDWSAHTDADWLEVERGDDGFGIHIHPRPGVNRGNVLVRDRQTGATRTVRVHVEITPEAPPPRAVAPRSPEAVLRERPTLVAGAALLVVMVTLAVVLVMVRTRKSTTTIPVPVPPDVVVDGTKPWTDTGIDIAAGDTVEITARGQVFHNQSSAVGPEGFPNRPDLLTPLPTANHAGMLRRVGVPSSLGTASYVGRGTTFRAESTGRLFLGINDGGLENNRGSFIATVTVPRR